MFGDSAGLAQNPFLSYNYFFSGLREAALIISDLAQR